MAPKPKTKGAGDMLAQAVKDRDAIQKVLDRENDKVAKAAEKATAAETKRREAVADRDAVQAELAEAQRLVDALSSLTDGVPDPQTVVPDGVESGEAVQTGDQPVEAPVASGR